MFRIRIDIVNDLNSDDIIEIVDSEAHVVVRHELPNGNPHYHAWIKTSLKENTIRLRLKRKFTQLKSSDYSIKKCDEGRVNEYVQYMFNTKHGNKWELIDTHNFDNQLLDDLKENAKKISTDFAESQTKSKSKGPTIWDIAQEVETIVKPQIEQTSFGYGRAEDFQLDSATEHKNITIYTDTAIHVLRKHKKAFDEFLLRKVISTAMSSDEFGKDKLRKKMIRNFATLI